MKKDLSNNEVKLFMAVTDANAVRIFLDKFPDYKIHVLISYHYARANLYSLLKLRKAERIKSLYLDSGAFSANTGKSTITLYEYTCYLNLYHDRFDVAFNFDDKFDDPGHNMENQAELSKKVIGKNIVPVLHDKGNLFEEFKDHVHLGYDFIAIGSNHNIPEDAWKNIEKHCEEIKKSEERDIKIHIFGRMKYEELWKHRPYSADSSTYAQAAGRGTLFIWDDENEKIIPLWTNEREKSFMDKVKDKDDDGSLKKKKKDKFYHLNSKEERFKSMLDNVLSKIDYTRENLIHNAEGKTIFNLYFYHLLEEYLNSDKAKERYLKLHQA